MPSSKLKEHRRTLVGKVVSDKMKKTAVVAVDRITEHPKYKKHFKITRKYKAHDEKNEYKVGDKVLITESRPISRDKGWRIVKKLS